MPDAMEPLYEELGRQVRSRRTALGWSQARLGEALRPPMTRASIANIEAGQQRVLLHTALDLAAALEVRFDDLLGRGPTAAGTGADPELLAEELASKLSISSDQARTLASKVSRKNRSVKQ
jgi:transcriptional regulator with XRE-family HTH domain